MIQAGSKGIAAFDCTFEFELGLYVVFRRDMHLNGCLVGLVAAGQCQPDTRMQNPKTHRSPIVNIVVWQPIMFSKQNVVVVGAGPAGIAIASGLSNKLDSFRYHVVLINLRPYAIPLPASLRPVVSEASKQEESALVPLDQLLKGNGETEVGVVKFIQPKRVSG